MSGLFSDATFLLAFIVGSFVLLVIILLFIFALKGKKQALEEDRELNTLLGGAAPAATPPTPSQPTYDKSAFVVKEPTQAEETTALPPPKVIHKPANVNQVSSILTDLKNWFKEFFGALSFRKPVTQTAETFGAASREAVDFAKRLGGEVSGSTKTIAHAITLPRFPSQSPDKNKTIIPPAEPKIQLPKPKIDFWLTVHNLNLINFWRITLRWWYFVIAGLVVAYVGVYFFNNFQPQIWKADAKIMIIQPVISENGALNPYIADQTALSVAKTINQITTTENFQDLVIQKAGLEANYVDQTEFRQNIKQTSLESLALGRNQLIQGENVKSTSVIMLSAVADDQNTALILANSAGQVLSEQVKTYFANYKSDLFAIEPALLEDRMVYPQAGRNTTIVLILAIAFELIAIYGVADAKLHHLKDL